MVHLLAYCFLLTAGWPSIAQTKSVTKSQEHYPYLLYLPQQYSLTKHAYPLVIYLHGGSLRGDDLNKLNVYGLPKLVDQGKQFDFIIASPQCPMDKYWSTDNWFEPLYSELTTKYRVDTSRIYLTGISMGGYGTWQTAVAYPDKLAAILPLCGGCDDSTQICRIKDVPVWTFHGTADDLIPVGITERLVKRLKECRGNVRFTRLRGEGHSIEHLYATKPKVYKWLLKQTKR